MVNPGAGYFNTQGTVWERGRLFKLLISGVRKRYTKILSLHRLDLRDILNHTELLGWKIRQGVGYSGDPKQRKIRNSQASHDAHPRCGHLPAHDDPVCGWTRIQRACPGRGPGL